MYRVDNIAFRTVPLIYSIGGDETSGLYTADETVTWAGLPESALDNEPRVKEWRLLTPYVTIVLILANIAVWVYVQGMGFDMGVLADSVCRLGAIPAEITGRTAGYDGPVPDWPLPSPSERELEVWGEAWRTPQACAWSMPSEAWRTQTVAMWVRVKVRCEDADAPASLLGQLHRFSDQIGMTTAGLAEMGWKVAVDAVAEKRNEPKPPVEDSDDPRAAYSCSRRADSGQSYCKGVSIRRGWLDRYVGAAVVEAAPLMPGAAATGWATAGRITRRSATPVTRASC